MLQAVRASKWVRRGMLLGILAFCCVGLALEWPQVHLALDHMHWYSVGGALGAAMASAGCMMLAWRRLLAGLGSKLSVPVAARISFVAQLGRYVPGAIWSIAAQVELAHDYDVPRRRGAASVIIAPAVAIATGLLIAAAILPLASPAIARQYLIFLAVVPVIAVCLAPPILHRLLGFVLKLVKQPPLDQPISWRGLAVALGWTVVGWLLLGLQVWFLLADMAKDGVDSLLISTGAYVLACSLAFLLVVFPGGIGAREVILVAALAPVLPHGAALAVALVARVVTTVSDLAWGGIAVLLGRSARYGQAARHVGKHRKAPARRPTARPALQPEMSAVGPTAKQATSPRAPEVAA